MPAPVASLSFLTSVARSLARVLGTAPLTQPADPEVAALVRRAEEALRIGRRDEARRLYREALDRHKIDLSALRGLRNLAVESGAWREALGLQERIMAQAASGERPRENEWLAAIHYEMGRADMGRGQPAAAIVHFKNALRAERAFLPAALALGDAWEASGDRREAVRAWERAVEQQPALPLLLKLERVYRDEGRPSRMIALYRAALDRAPDDMAIAVALGRVYFELEMLDEAADQFEKIEVRAPALPAVHAFLGSVFERRGETREAFEEYRRALRLSHAFDWPQRCTVCGVTAPAWGERCAQCGRWNTLRPVAGR